MVGLALLTTRPTNDLKTFTTLLRAIGNVGHDMLVHLQAFNLASTGELFGDTARPSRDR
jgi:hypothetical protein